MATDLDLDYLERELRVVLPDLYRQLLLRYPPELTIGRGGADPVATRQLINGVDLLIELNREFRELWHRLDCDPPTTADGGRWPKDYFVIGRNGQGGLWLINIAVGDAVVYFYDHELDVVRTSPRHRLPAPLRRLGYGQGRGHGDQGEPDDPSLPPLVL